MHTHIMTTPKLCRLLVGFLVALVAGVFTQIALPAAAKQESNGPIVCENPKVTDGDTLRCGELRIRLAGIDAPEMKGHCRKGRKCTPGDPIRAKEYLKELVGDSTICQQTGRDRYGRLIARCASNERDLSCAMVAAGHAVIRYGKLSCQ